MLSVYTKQTSARDDLKQELVVALQELPEHIATGDFSKEPLRSKFIKLAEDLSHIRNGKKSYGYLPKVLKEQVDTILDLFAKDEIIRACYTEWNTLRQEVLNTYQDKQADIIPLSEQKEFHHLKNVILQSAKEYTLPTPPRTVIELVDSSLVFLEEHTATLIPEKETSWREQKTADPQKSFGLNHLWGAGYQACRHALYLRKKILKRPQSTSFRV